MKRRTEVTQALQREEIRTKRNGDVFAGDESDSIDCAEVRTDIDEDPRRGELFRGPAHRAVERAHRAKCRFIPVMASRPRIRKLVLERGEGEISNDEPQPW